ncbi:hypothetical protein [Pseudomonas lurida]|uniref:hypothetical protein n=1 Tax=Pseudomonas lurida TaxID=244566 RepID=UPI0034D96C09
MVWQRSGTVSVQNGSTTVVGANVDFAASCRNGDSFVGPDGATYEVANVASATVISILPAYKGATVSGASYAIMPVQGYDKMLSDAFNALVNQFGAKLAALGTTGNYDILPAEKGGTGHSHGLNWGYIGGNITGQDDLKAALDSKVTGSKQGLVTASVLFAGGGPTIINNFNVASITKVTTGIYDINFASPMDNTAYVAVAMACDDSAVQSIMYENGSGGNTRSLNKVRVVAGVPGGSTRDFTLMSVVVIGGKN